ncbi:hypothetical protein LCGC14_2588470, partial [marine sediment metagenome]
MGDVRLIAGEAGRLTVATSPPMVGLVAQVTAFYGIDGEDILDGLPLDMDEGADGFYSIEVDIASAGPYWARVEVDGQGLEPIIVRVVPDGFPAADAQAESAVTIIAVAPGSPSSIDISVYDSDGSQIGTDSAGDDYAWPQGMTQVAGHTDSWYFEDVTISEGGRMQVVMQGDSGPAWNDILVVHQDAQGSIEHFSGWDPDAAYVPSSWVSIGYIRKWTGWSTSYVPDSTIRELRALAIETFIEETHEERESLGVGLRFGIVSVSEEVIAFQRKRLGDHEVIDFVTLDWGHSYISRVDIFQLAIVEALPVTLSLAAYSLIFSLGIGIP